MTAVLAAVMTAAVEVVGDAGSVVAKPVYVGVAAGFVYSFVPDTVEPIPKCDLTSFPHPYRQISMVPSVVGYLRSMSLVTCFARSYVDQDVESPVSSAPLPVFVYPPQLWLAANFASTRHVQPIATAGQVNFLTMLCSMVPCPEVTD